MEVPNGKQRGWSGAHSATLVFEKSRHVQHGSLIVWCGDLDMKSYFGTHFKQLIVVIVLEYVTNNLAFNAIINVEVLPLPRKTSKKSIVQMWQLIHEN